MIGSRTGKCIGYAVRSKTCRTCDSAKDDKTEHDCRLNWTGSAKAMEPDMVCEMVTSAKKQGVTISTVIGDEDSTTIAKLRSDVSPHIQKRSDKNHLKKIIGNSLYSLRKKHKQLSVKVIKYFQKCFSYMVSDNQGNPDGILTGLKAMYNHPFGEHTYCSQSWCRFLSDSNAKYRSLPYGKPLSDVSLQTDVQDLFGKFEEQPEKLAHLSSTQANESLNKTVASKAPKTHHFSGSESLSYRVAAAVAQKNAGHTYVSRVCMI